MNKLKLYFTAAALLAAGFHFTAADHIPVAPAAPLDFQARAAALLDFGKLDALVEIAAGLQDTSRELRYKALTLGGYYRLFKNLKLGAFYRLQFGVRHDDDWVALNPGWAWRDTRERAEHVLMLDASPRFGLDFLPGRDWVFLFKARWIYNTFNAQQSLLLKPGLTWFWMVDRLPVVNLSLSYEVYLPLNFGSTPVYQHYPYLNAIWHVHPNLMLELGGAYKSVVWSSLRDVKNAGQPGYTVDARSWVISLGALFPYSFQ